MKKRTRPALYALLLTLSIGRISAADREIAPYIIDVLRTYTEARAPEILEDAVIFSASAKEHQRVGIAFAHEHYAAVHWFHKLMEPRDPMELAEAKAAKKNLSATVDTGLLFHVAPLPRGVSALEYRIITGGLWTRDPLNPDYRSDASGTIYSLLRLPPPAEDFSVIKPEKPGVLDLAFHGAPGETVTVAGSFNSWDPYMYELAEVRPGEYRLGLPLPPGLYRYVFFYRGERVVDDHNPRKAYTPDGKTVSEVEVR
ncbi:MAG: isoamylase [Treponema sp.]|nr:isoamylase [Treponema sp.]